MTTQPTPTKYQCPECDARYDDARGLGTHRRLKHGIKGSAPSTIAARKKKSGKTRVHTRLKGQFPCTHEGCKFIAKWKGGLTNHLNTTHRNTKRSLQLAKQTLPPIASDGAGVNHSNPQETYVAPDGIPEAVIAFTAGRVQELCAVTASQFNIPAKPFTARVIELIYATTLRQ